MEENKNLNEMNAEQTINNEPVLENPVADMAPVAETPVVETTPEVAPVAETPVVEAVPEVAPVAETPVVETAPEVAPVAETPVVEAAPEVAPVAETPVVEAAPVTPVAETPVVEAAPVAPVVETPVVEAAPVAPVAENPVVEAAPAAPAVETTTTPETAPGEGSAPATEEKKKAPVNIVAVLIIIVCCVVGGYLIYTRYIKPSQTPAPTPNPNPVVTPNDDNQGNVDVPTEDVVNHPVATADKYTVTVDGGEYTIYLKTGTSTFYFLTNGGCLSGQTGTYTEVDGNLTLQSDTYYNCESCYFTAADANNNALATQVLTFTKDLNTNTLTSSDGVLVMSYVGAEEVGNPFNLEGVHSCDNQENAN